MKITDILAAEHGAFTRLFDQVESALAACSTLPEIQLLGRLVEGVLRHHGATEDHLVYAVLDHVLEEKGQLDRLHQDHREIDAQLRHLAAAPALDEARRHLHSALQASREHFRNEETVVFPLIQRILRPETLTELGQSYLQRQAAEAGSCCLGAS